MQRSITRYPVWRSATLSNQEVPVLSGGYLYLVLDGVTSPPPHDLEQDLGQGPVTGLGVPPGKDLGLEAGVTPLKRTWTKGCGTSGKDLGPEVRVPPLWTDKQTENITFPRTSYAGGKYDTIIMVIVPFSWLELAALPSLLNLSLQEKDVLGLTFTKEIYAQTALYYAGVLPVQAT